MKLYPSKLCGCVRLPSSKSFIHRAVIASSLSEGKSEIHNLSLSEDIESTLKAMQQLGSEITQKDNDYIITGHPYEASKDNLSIFCSESASTLRFLIPFALLQKRKLSFYGKGNLPNRPLDPYFSIFRQCNIIFKKNPEESGLCISLEGELKAGHYILPGNISSQFISGLLFALPLLSEDSTLTLSTPLESASYVDMTLEILHLFGVHILQEENSFFIKGKQKYLPQNISIEGDYSQAAFFFVANSLGNQVEIQGLKEDSKQGDAQILSFLSMLEKKNANENLILDAGQCPDIVPILSLRAALTPGKTKIINIARLRLKECDRLHATAVILNALGAKVEEGKDYLEFEGVSHLVGNSVSSYGDHRMAMTIAIASTCCQGEIVLDNADCVKKSYPKFWEDFQSLGGKYYVG